MNIIFTMTIVLISVIVELECRGALCPPKFLKTKNSGKSSGKFGQKRWDIRAKAMGEKIENSGKSNGNFRKKQWEIRAKGIIFARNICRRFPSFLIAFAQIFPLLLPEFPLLLPEFPIAFSRNSGKSNWKFWQKQWRNLCKSNEKTRKLSGGIYFGQKLRKFWAISRIDILFSKFTS